MATPWADSHLRQPWRNLWRAGAVLSRAWTTPLDHSSIPSSFPVKSPGRNTMSGVPSRHEHLLLRRDAQQHHRTRPGAARPHARPARGRRPRARKAWSICARSCCRAAARRQAWRSPARFSPNTPTLTTGPRIAFFEALAHRFGPDRTRLDAAIAAWQAAPSDKTAAAVHAAAEPRRQELLRRLNLAPGGTAALVRMREQLLDALDHRDDLAAVDADFVHLFSSWFNRGFLVLRRIDWSTPAMILEKIIRYEAVHRIRSWDDLRRRIDPPDRRCYAFFHPALVDEPLIFVEVALTREIPDAIAPILSVQRDGVDPDKVTTAAFYSISNCQRGLAGVSFGNFLIKQVVEEISRENAAAQDLRHAVAGARLRALARPRAQDRESGALSPERPGGARRPRPAEAGGSCRRRASRCGSRCCAPPPGISCARATAAALPVDPVARFHLGNGARLERLNWLGRRQRERHRAVARADGELPLRSRRHREEPRGLCRRAARWWLRARSGACCARPPADLVPVPVCRLHWAFLRALSASC